MRSILRYCRNKKTGFLLENPVFYLVRFLQLAAFEMQEEGVKRDMVGGKIFRKKSLRHFVRAAFDFPQ